MVGTPTGGDKGDGALNVESVYVNGVAVDTEAIVPTGAITMYGGSTAPSGWKFCDGSAISRTTFSDLFTAIGTTFGAGDGSTTFNLPDLRGRAPIGVGQGSGLSNRLLGDTGGAATHQLTESEMPSHTHSVPSGANQTSTYQVNGGSSSQVAAQTTGSTGGDAAHENMPPFLAVNFMIKT